MVCVCVDGQVDEWVVTLALALTLTLTLNPNPNPSPNPNPPRPAGSRCLHRSRTNPHSLPDTGVDMMNLI